MQRPEKPDATARSKKKLTAAKFKLLARASTDNDLGAGSVYRVLIYAVEKADATGRFWKKNSTIAREIGIDRATVIRALNKLTVGGYIERRGRHNGIGNSCNVYNLALDLGGAIKAAKREQRRKEKFVHEQEANTTEKPPRWGRNPATPEVAAPPPQESQPCNTYTSLSDNPSPESLGVASLASPPEGGSRSSTLADKKQVVQQESGKLVEDGVPIGESAASGNSPVGEPSSPFPANDTTDEFGPLKTAKKSAVDALGRGRFLAKDMELNHRLAAVPADARDGLRRLEYELWAEDPADEWQREVA